MTIRYSRFFPIGLFLVLSVPVFAAAPVNKPADDNPAQWDVFSKTNGSLTHFVMEDWDAANPVMVKDMGAMSGFYRYTQLQGHLIQDGLSLYKVPDFWCTGSDFPYLKKKSDREVFFVDEFSITRFLGGYSQQWKHKGLQLKTNDMAYVEDGKIKYRLNLVKDRLQPYIDNGYTRFIIGIENIWDLSRDPSKSGPYGPTEPPRDWNEWHDFIKAVCEEMKRVYPEEVCRNLKFKIGNEYNQKKSFIGTHEDFLKMYDYSAAAIRSVFPLAEIMPGELAGPPSGPDNSIDYPKLYQHFLTGTNYAGLPHPSPVSGLLRSAHSFPAMEEDLSPKERVEFSVDSFKEVLAGKPKEFVDGLSIGYPQFGVLGSRFSGTAYPVGSRIASWQFQVLFRTKAAGYLDKCWSWEKAERIEFNKTTDTHILSGLGWLYMVLDHMQGDQTYLLGVLQPDQPERDITAVSFVNDKRVTVILGSWSRDPDATNTMPVLVDIPDSILPFGLSMERAKMISFTDDENVYSEIKRDLKASGNLQPVFAEHSKELATIKNMATDYLAARKMVAENIKKYEKIQQESLTLKSVPGDKISLTVAPRVPQVQLSAKLAPDEVLVLVFAKPEQNRR